MFLRLVLLFTLVPLIELILFIKIGGEIGIPWTVAIILVTGFLGAWLTKLQGLKTLARFRLATAEGRLPHKEIMDGLMILVAGAVLLTPGFLTDAFGFALLVPPFRALVRTGLRRYLKDRVEISGIVSPGSGAGESEGRGSGSGSGGGGGKGPVIIEAEAEVIEERGQ